MKIKLPFLSASVVLLVVALPVYAYNMQQNFLNTRQDDVIIHAAYSGCMSQSDMRKAKQPVRLVTGEQVNYALNAQIDGFCWFEPSWVTWEIRYNNNASVQHVQCESTGNMICTDKDLPPVVTVTSQGKTQSLMTIHN